MKRNKLIIILSALTGILFLSYDNQKSHPSINEIIVDGFESRNNKYESSMYGFQDYVFSLDIGKLKGNYISKSGLFNPSEVPSAGDMGLGNLRSTYEEKQKEMTAKKWIEHGGYSADVPEVPASLRHFYDPTKSEGKRYLTDKINSKVFETAKSFMDNPHTDGVEWALGRKGNFGVLEHNYTWENGKAYLVRALEEPVVNKRKTYMAKAWRALGETLHMIADNGCPPHVRNDGHPSIPIELLSYFGNPDPYEEIMAVTSVGQFQNGPVDKDLKEAFISSETVFDIAHALAVFTNSNFFSNETISGTDVNGTVIKPITNPDYVYDSPKISHNNYENDYYYYRTIAGKKIKMCTDMQFFKGMAVWRTYPYIDLACVESQASVLIPAIKEAGIYTMKLFIPSIKVEISYIEDDGTISGIVSHKTDKEYENQINYNGPVYIKNTKRQIIKTLNAKNGEFEGRLGNVKGDIFAEIAFGGVAVRSKFEKAHVDAFTLGRKRFNKELSWPSSTRVNDPLARLSSLRDISFNVSENGDFQTVIPGSVFKKNWDTDKAYDSNNGVHERIGDVVLKGKIENMRKVEDYLKNGGHSSGVKVGSMSYSSNGSFVDREKMYSGSDQSITNCDYSFSVSAEYDLYVILDTRKMDAPVAIEARIIKESRKYQGLPEKIIPSSKGTIVFQINK